MLNICSLEYRKFGNLSGSTSKEFPEDKKFIGDKRDTVTEYVLIIPLGRACRSHLDSIFLTKHTIYA